MLKKIVQGKSLSFTKLIREQRQVLEEGNNFQEQIVDDGFLSCFLFSEFRNRFIKLVANI